MKKVNYISIIVFAASIALVSCSKMAPLNERQECGTKSNSNPIVIESTAMSTGNGGSDTGSGNITDPDHDTDHDRDKSKPKAQ
jgi:hypothetical protein